jgi:hypothetical protein
VNTCTAESNYLDKRVAIEAIHGRNEGVDGEWKEVSYRRISYGVNVTGTFPETPQIDLPNF